MSVEIVFVTQVEFPEVEVGIEVRAPLGKASFAAKVLEPESRTDELAILAAKDKMQRWLVSQKADPELANTHTKYEVIRRERRLRVVTARINAERWDGSHV